MSKDLIVVNGRNPTIEYGMELLGCDPKLPNAILAKKIGLQLTLLGLSEVQSLRISNLAIAAYELEQRLYAPENIVNVDTKRLLSTYEAVNKALNEALNYVSNTQALDWVTVASQLKELSAGDDTKVEINPEDEENQRKISATARELLELVTNHGKE